MSLRERARSKEAWDRRKLQIFPGWVLAGFMPISLVCYPQHLAQGLACSRCKANESPTPSCGWQLAL